MTTNYWKLGLFVVLCIGMLFGWLVFFGVHRLQRQFFPVYAYFNEPVDGLDIGSPVKYRGIRIGEVARIRPAADLVHIEVTAHIYFDVVEDLGLRDPNDPSAPLEGPGDQGQRDRLRVMINRSFLTGLAFLETDFVDPAQFPPKTYPFPTKKPMLQTIPSRLRSLEVGLQETITVLPATLRDVQSLLQSVQQKVDAVDVKGTMARVDTLLDEVNQRVKDLDNMPLIATSTSAAGQLEGLLRDLRTERQSLPLLVEKMNGVVELLGQQVTATQLPETSATVRTLADTYSQLGRNLDLKISDLDLAIASLRNLLELLERDPGALIRGRTVTSPGGSR